MENLIWVIVIGLIVVAVLFYLKFKMQDAFLEDSDDVEHDSYPFKKREFLLNIPERKFFEALKEIVPADYDVFPQMQLSNIVDIDNAGSKFWKYRNRINRKTVDFVIFEKPYYKPVLAIEYDGRTHEYSKRIERDLLVSRILDHVGINNFHVKHNNVDFNEIKDKLSALSQK